MVSIKMNGNEYNECKIEKLKEFRQKLREKHFVLQYGNVSKSKLRNGGPSGEAQPPRADSNLINTNAQYRKNWQEIEMQFQHTARRIDYLRKRFSCANHDCRELFITSSQEWQNLINLCSTIFLQDAQISIALSKIKNIFRDIMSVEKKLKLKGKEKEVLNAELRRNLVSLAREVLHASLESAAVALENSTLSELLLETHQKLHAIVDEKNRQLKALKLLNCEFHSALTLADYLTGMLSQAETEEIEKERSVENLKRIYSEQIKNPNIEVVHFALEFRIQLADEAIGETTELLKTVCNDLNESGLHYEKEVIKEKIAKIELKKCHLENMQSSILLTEFQYLSKVAEEELNIKSAVLDAFTNRLSELGDFKYAIESHVNILRFVQSTNAQELKVKKDRLRALNHAYGQLVELVNVESAVRDRCLLECRIPSYTASGYLPLTTTDPQYDDVNLDFELSFRQFPDNDLGENEMLYILEMLLANNDDQKCLELFWKTARARVSRFEEAVLLANNGHCTVGNSVVQKLKIILLKITTLDDVLNELLTYCGTLLHHEFGAKYASCTDDEIKVLIDKHAKLMEQYENFQEEKGRLFEIRHICDVLNARLFELYESVKETRREKFQAGVRTPVNVCENLHLHFFPILTAIPILFLERAKGLAKLQHSPDDTDRKSDEIFTLKASFVHNLQKNPFLFYQRVEFDSCVQKYFNQSKKELTETLERRQRYYDHNLPSRRNMTNSSNMQERREMGEFSSETSSAGQSNESTTCNCGRSECNVCNPPAAENAQ
ncbi:hypothetical protein T12_5410 [Trichinella patagoniensis]|uniref:Uncharacterized protein n=1 Tax=Trichinella patagoniensis TaxID=990121 RepID=A0A0V0ZIW7_9BILA|nr:hypothetical protein T12_5410 [Trichinella patagoniensis]